MNENTKENKMGVVPVNRLLITMAVPMVISMLVQALYNIVDSMYVSRITDAANPLAGENALAAVSMAFPVQNIMIALSAGIGVGLSALVSRALGQKDKKTAGRTAAQGIILYLIMYAVTAVLGFTLSGVFSSSQTGDTYISSQCTSYLVIITTLSFGIYMQIMFERLLQSTGKTVLTMITQGVGAIINIVLDPVFIFGFGPVPAMGVSGAAVATVIGQIIAGFTGLILHVTRNREVVIKLKNIKPDFQIIKRILGIGIPSAIMGSIGSVMSYGMNKILFGFDSTAVSVFGAYFKLQSFAFMPMFGMTNAMIPIVSYNYGADKPDRITKVIKLSALYGSCFMLICTILFLSVPSQLLGIFNATDRMLEIGVPALRIISAHFIFAGISIICSSTFQALGHGVYSMSMSILRQVVILLPVAYLFSLTRNINLVWISFPTAEICSMIMGLILFSYLMKKLFKKLPDNLSTADIPEEEKLSV